MKTPASLPSDYLQTVDIHLGDATLTAQMLIPRAAKGLIIFTYSGARLHHVQRNTLIAKELHRYKLAALCIDLLTAQEATIYQNTYDVPLLTRRLVGVTAWAMRATPTRLLPIGYFSAGANTAAAFKIASRTCRGPRAIVSISGRTDLAHTDALHVAIPTLLIVGHEDLAIREVNEQTLNQLSGRKKMAVIAHAAHIFEHPQALECTVRLASSWFHKYVRPSRIRRTKH